MNDNKLGRRQLSVVALLFCAAGSVAAQEQPLLEEIIVTARKQPEPLRDVPISISTIDGRKLAESGIEKTEALSPYVPNFAMSETGIGNEISMRGIFSGENPGFQQSVGTFVDGIYHGRGQQARAPYMDLERIEVLRGSQSILFGNSSIGGALNITTAQPTATPEGSISALYEPDTNEQQLTAHLSGPLNEAVRGRLAIRRRTEDGYIENLTLGRPEPQRDELSARATIAWDRSPDSVVTFMAEKGRFDVTGRQVEILRELPAVAGPFAGLDYAQILLALGQDPSVANDTQDFARSSNGDFSDNDSLDLMLSITSRIGSLSFASISGYSGYRFNELCDCDFTGADVFKAGFREKFHQFSQEFRVTSPTDGALSYVLGLYYETSDLNYFDTLYVDAQSIIVPIVNALTMSTTGQYFANTGTPRYFSQDGHRLAVFGQVTWSLSDRLRLTGGLRLTDERKDGARSLTIADIDGNPLPEPNATIAPLLYAGLFNVRNHDISGSRSEVKGTPSLSVQYDFGADRMAYLTVTRGSKSGGFDERSNNAPADGGSFEFGDETATNFEGGVKIRLPGGAAELDAGVYHTTFEGLQVSVFDGVLGYNVKNAGAAVTQGIELDGRWAVNDRLMLTGAVGTIDFEFKDYFGQCALGQIPDAPDGRNCNYRGRTNQYAPDWSGSASADYVRHFDNGLALRAVLDIVYSDDFLRSPNLDPTQVQGAFSKLNGRVSIGANDGRWEVALVGKNLTDRVVIPYSLDTPLAGASFGAPSVWGFVDPPRTVAVQASFAF